MKDDFVLSTEDAAVFDFKVKPTFESEEENLSVSKEKGIVSLRISKSMLNIKFSSEAFDDSYSVLNRLGWKVTDFVNFNSRPNGNNILDDNKSSFVTYNFRIRQEVL